MENMKNNDNIGGLVISEDVISSIAINAAKDIKGVSSFPIRPTDIKGVFKVGSSSIKAVRVDSNDNEIIIKINVNLKSGSKIQSVCEEVQSSIKDAVQNMTGRVVTRVDVNVCGVDFEESAAVNE